MWLTLSLLVASSSLDWLGPRGWSADDVRATMTTADFQLSKYFALAAAASNQTGSMSVRQAIDVPALLQATRADRAPSRRVRIIFVGDSIAREMASSCASTPALAAALNCSWNPTWHFCANITNTGTCNHAHRILQSLAVHADVLWFSWGLHNLRRRKPQQKEASPRAPAEYEALGMSRVRAPEFMKVIHFSKGLAIHGVRIVISTMVPIDDDVFWALGGSGNHELGDWYPTSVSGIWADVDARDGARFLAGSSKRVLLAPLHELMRRYVGQRCDGMHLGSWRAGGSDSELTKAPSETDSCSPKLCLYAPLLAVSIAAVLGERDLAEQLAVSPRVNVSEPDRAEMARCTGDRPGAQAGGGK